MKNTISELKNAYLRLAEENSLYKADGNYKKANFVHKELSKVSHLLTSSDEGRAELVKLLDHKSSAVRLWAAADLRLLFPEKVKKALNLLAKEDSLVSVEAKLLLGDYL